MLCVQLGKRTGAGVPAQVRGDRQDLGVRTGWGKGLNSTSTQRWAGKTCLM